MSAIRLGGGVAGGGLGALGLSLTACRRTPGRCRSREAPGSAPRRRASSRRCRSSRCQRRTRGRVRGRPGSLRNRFDAFRGRTAPRGAVASSTMLDVVRLEPAGHAGLLEPLEHRLVELLVGVGLALQSQVLDLLLVQLLGLAPQPVDVASSVSSRALATCGTRSAPPAACLGSRPRCAGSPAGSARRS